MVVSDKNLLQYYTEEMNDGVLCDNTIISMFDGRLYHCGLADRLRGISSVYHFCKTQSRGFKLNFIHPFELTNYLIPNCYDWRINPDSIIYNLSLSKPITLFCDGKPNEIMRHRFFLERACSSDKQIHIYSNTLCYDEYYYADFHELFSISSYLKNKLEPHLKELGMGYISASFRFCNLLGDFRDILTPLSDLEQTRLIQIMLNFVHSLEQRHANKKILVTSDSHKFLDEANKMSSVYTVPGPIKHLNSAFITEQIEKTFVDFFLISKAEIAYTGYTSQMYRGAFAERAALTGGVPFSPVYLDV